LSGFLGFCLPGWHQLPERRHIQQYTIVNVRPVAALLNNSREQFMKFPYVIQNVFEFRHLFFQTSPCAPLGTIALYLQLVDLSLQMIDLGSTYSVWMRTVILGSLILGSRLHI